MSIHFFYGQEYYFLEKEIKKMKSEYLNSDFITMNYKTFDNPSGAELIECCQSAPLMFGDMLCVIDIDDYLIGNDKSLSDAQLESFEYALKNVNPSVHLVFVCKIDREETKKPDTRKKFYKILTKYANPKEFPIFKNWDKQLPSIIIDIAKEKGLKLPNNVCSYIIEQIGTDLTLIDSELTKLVSAIHPRTTIETNDIKNFCTVTEEIFNLADNLALGNHDEILKQYNILTEKQHPLKILAVLHGSLSKYIVIKSCEKNYSDSQIGAKLGIHEFVVKKTREKFRKIPLERFLMLQKELTEAEYKYKTGQALLPDLLIEITLMR